MTGKRRALFLSGASGLTIAAALIFIPTEANAACAAFADIRGVAVVDIVCQPGDPDVETFATSYSNDGPVSDGNGNDTLTMSGGAVVQDSDLFTPLVDGGPDLDISAGAIEMFGGDDVVTISGGTIGASTPVGLSLGAGADFFQMSGGTITGSVFGLDGNDTLIVSGGTINGSLFGNDGNDSVTISGAANIQGNAAIGPDSVGLEGGDDAFTMTGGTLGGAVSGGLGNDTLTISGGTITGSVFGLAGNDTLIVSGGTIIGSLFGNGGNDSVTISGAANIQGNAAVGPDSVGLEGGDDAFTMTGGTLGGAVSGGLGNDTLTISGGTIGSFVAGNEGADQISVSGGTIQDDVRGNEGEDQVTVSGGTIAGDVEAETVRLFGGAIGGDITGITGNTLVIDDSVVSNPLNLRNGVIFSGTNAVGSITNTDLAAGGTKTQVFTGFANVNTSNSTLGFGTGTIGIGQLILGNGSTLFVNGSVNMPGTLTVNNSTINMIDGAAGDVLTLGGLALNNGTIGVDLNQQTIQADQLVAGTFSATGANTIIVNLLGTPQFAGPTDIPIIVAANGPVAGTFIIQTIPGTTGSLFTYQLIVGPNGGLFIRASPGNFGVAAAPNSAVNAATVDTAVDALYGINNDAIDMDLGLANGVTRAQISPTFGVFASGQLAHLEHDGFTITNNDLVGTGPSFDANDFSAAISLDFNAAKHFGFEDQYGLNLGLFAGYASTDVGLGAFQGFDRIGDADNASAMFGGYGLFRREYNYLLVSASAFLGETDVTSGVLNTTGSYDTQGYAVTGSVGHIFALTDRIRFDLRGGLLGVTFTGDDYTDSGGNQFGKSHISFGAFKFEPGIYADYQLENGRTFSPYARADLQPRFSYKNTVSLDGREIDFDDSNFSAAMSTGFNLKMSEQTTVSAEVRGKVSADSSTFGGKLGLKVVF